MILNFHIMATFISYYLHIIFTVCCSDPRCGPQTSCNFHILAHILFILFSYSVKTSLSRLSIRTIFATMALALIITNNCLPGFTTVGEPEAIVHFNVDCNAYGEWSAPSTDMQCRNVNDCEENTCGPNCVAKIAVWI